MRKKEIIKAIENKIIIDKVDTPTDISRLDSEVEAIEIELRELIANKLNQQSDSFKSYIPSNIQQKVNERIVNEKKKNPYLGEVNTLSFREKLNYFDLSEYLQVITNKLLWSSFEELFEQRSLNTEVWTIEQYQKLY